MISTEVEQQNIISGLKKISKIKKITYGEIAKNSDIPESTLRKIFSGRDCKLITILKICRALDVELNDVIRESQKDHFKDVFKLTQEQSEYFLIHLDAYWVFIMIMRKVPLSQMLKDFGGDEYRFVAILKELEKVGLIERLPENKVRIIPKGNMQLEDGVPLHNKIVELVVSRFIQALNTSQAGPITKLHQQGSVKMTGATFRKFIEKIREVFMEIEVIYKKENDYYSSDRSELIDVTYVLGVAEFNSINIFLDE